MAHKQCHTVQWLCWVLQLAQASGLYFKPPYILRFFIFFYLRLQNKGSAKKTLTPNT